MSAETGTFSRYRIIFGLVVAVCVSALIGVGCGGGSSVSSINILNTLSGRVLDESAPASVRAAGTLVGVPGAQVWIEDLAADALFHTVSGENGEYAFHGVPEGPHRVVAKFTDASGVKKARSYAVVVPIGAETTVVESLVLEQAKNYVIGILRDTNGAYLPYGSVLRLWGEAFTIGRNGTFTSPPLPEGIYEEFILVQTGLAGQVSVITAPFVSAVMPAFMDLRIDMTGSSANHPPSGTLIARNATGIASSTGVGGTLSITANGYDPDVGESDQLLYQWAATLGTLEAGSTPKEKTFRAPNHTGVATISVIVTDPRWATGTINLPLLIGINSPSEADLTPPTATLTSLVAETFDNAPFQVRISFSETITGFASADLTVTNGTVTGLAAVPPGTAYIATITPSVIGDVSIGLPAAAVTDNGGNANLAVSAITVSNRVSVPDDTIPPVDPTITAVTTPTNVTPQVISGTKSADTVTVLVNGTGLGVTYPTTTTWQYSLALVEGANAISVKSRDAAGNESGVVTSSIVYDSVAPAAPTITAVTTPTNVTPQIISGTKPADAATVLVNGSSLGVTFPTATTWQYSMALTSGENVVSVTCRDVTGNVSGATVTGIWFADVPPSAPTGVTLSPVGGTVVANILNSTNTNLMASATIVAGQASGGEAELLFNGASFDPQVKDTSIVNGETTVTFDLGLAGNAAVQAKFSDGGVFSVRLRDAFGNTSISTVGNPTLVVDYAAPVAPVISATAISPDLGGTGNTADHINVALKVAFNNFKVSVANTGVGNEAGMLYIKLSDSNGTPNTWTTSGQAIAAGAAAADSGTFTAGAIDAFIDGNLVIEAWITDAAGNSSAHDTVTKTYGIDAQAPAVAVSDDHPDACVADADTVIITATFTEADQIDETTVPAITIGTLVNGASMTKTDNLHWTYTWNVPADSDGDHAVSITAKDRAGNACSPATGKTSYTVDNTAPSKPTNVALAPVGGTVVANTLNSTNTNLTVSATIVAGEATGGEAELLLGGNPIGSGMKDTSIAVGDTTVTFDFGLLNNDDLKAKFPAGGEFSVRISDVCGNTSVSTVGNPTLVVDYSVPAAPVVSAIAITADLGGTGNTADHINAALKAAFDSFKVSIANTAGGNESGTLFIKLSDANGTPHVYTTAGDAIAAGAAVADVGTFAAGAIDAFVDGNLGIEAWIADAAGNASLHVSVEKTYAFDSASPTAVLSDDHTDAIVCDADTVVITATFTEADQIDETTVPAITIGTLVTGAAMTKTDNLHWTYTWNVPADNNGNHAVTIEAEDRAGNMNAPATGKTIYTIDNIVPTAPTAVTLTPVGGTVVANTLNTTNTNLTAGATITPGEATGGEAELLIDGNSFAPPMKDTSIAADDSTVTFDFGLLNNTAVQTKFPSGGVITVRLKDAAGNAVVSTVANPTLVVDYVLPAAPVISATAITANLGGTGNMADHINAALKNAFNNFKVSLANTGANNEAGTLFIKLIDSSATPHSYTTSGNAIAAGAGVADTGTFVAGAINAFIDGNIGVEAWIIDAAGNESTHASVVKTYGLDSAAPSVVLSDYHADAVVRDADTVTITATFTEADQIDEATPPTITIGALGTTNMAKTTNKVWTYEWNVPAGSDGTYAVSVTAKDRSGNSSTAATGKISYTIDNTFPTVTKLGNGPGDCHITKNTPTNLVFSEVLSADSQADVITALQAEANVTATYTWSGATLIIAPPKLVDVIFPADVLLDVSDIAGNVSPGLLLIDSSVLPTVVKLGDGLSDYTIPQDVGVTLTFSGGVVASSRSVVTAALTAGAVNTPSYSWNGAKTILTITGGTGGTTFPNDVMVDVTDSDENITRSLLLIDSAP